MGKTGKRPTKPKGNGRPASAKKPTPGCYVLSLTVENIRCFGPKQTLDCSDGEGRPKQWTVILGDNGTGKTTLLKAVGIGRYFGFAFMHAPLGLRTGASSAVAEVELALGRLSELATERHVYTMLGEKPTEQNSIAAEVWNTKQQWSLSGTKGRWYLVAYGTARGNIEQSVIPEPDRFNAHLGDFLDSITKLRDAQSWLISLDYSSRLPQESLARQRLEQVKSLLVGIQPGEGVLPDVADLRFDGGSGVFPQPRVEFLTSYGWVPLRQLGHGYQTMIAWVTDFVSRMVERYPESENPLAEPAVCLVDEIDLHLHPVWQRKVIGYLSERFPNTQFIVTAHSPLVVQAAASADANIAVLVRSTEKDADGNHYVEIRNNPEDVHNWRLDQILTSALFGGIDLRSVETEKLFARKRELLDKAKLNKVEAAELADIEAKIAELPVGDTKKFKDELQLLRDALDALKPATHRRSAFTRWRYRRTRSFPKGNRRPPHTARRSWRIGRGIAPGRRSSISTATSTRRTT